MLTKPTVSNHVRMNAICPTTPKNRMCVHSFHLKQFIPIQNSLRLTKYEITALLERLQQTMGDSKKCQTERFFPQVFFPTHLHFIILKKAKEKKKDFLKCASWTDTLVVTMSKRAWERRL